MIRTSIKEGALPRNMKSRRLTTNLQGGGKCVWAPESDARLVTKYITKNGVYVSDRDGAYGYSSISVNVVSAGVTGLGSDGKQHTITTDKTTGQLVDRVAPVSISIVQTPHKLAYHDGETIDITGIVVDAYDSDSINMGHVLTSELITDRDTAVYDQSVNNGVISIGLAWIRPGDEIVLTTSYNVTVTQK